MIQHLPHLLGLTGHALVWGSLFALWARRYRPTCNLCHKTPSLIWILPALVALTGLAWFSRGIGSDLSITGMGLGFCWLVRRPIKLPLWLMAGWLIIGLVLYMSTMGLITPDFYSAGFAPKKLLLGVLVWIAICGWFSPTFGWILALGLLAFASKAMVSVNLWDYLIDPVTWLIGAYKMLAQIRLCWRSKQVTLCASGKTIIAVPRKA